MKKAVFMLAMALCYVLSFSQETGTFTDSRDGKVYKTIKIGNQTWLAENLAFKPPVGYYSYNNDSNLVRKFGYLYHWETAKTICPKGWHMPTIEEWAELSKFLGGRTPNYWKGNNAPVEKMMSTNGFSALQAGTGFIVRDKTNYYLVEYDGYSYKYYYFGEKDWFALSGEYGGWWTEKNGKGSIIWLSYSGGLACSKKSWDRICSIRCIKD